MDENNKNKFLNYIHKPMSLEAIKMVYTKHNIIYEKCELYLDFTKSLLIKIFDTYLGDDITNQDEQYNHFNWCWKKNIEDFKNEGFNFDEITLYSYFLEFSFEVFYSNKEKNKIDFYNGLIKIWEDLFNYNKTKTNSDLDALVEIYLLMEKAIKNNKI
jgi:hypothetical protein